MCSILKRYFIIIYFFVTFLIFSCSTLNYYLYETNVKIVCYVAYLTVVVLSIMFSYKQTNLKIVYTCEALTVLTLLVLDDYFICALMLIFILFLLKNIKKFKWLHLAVIFIWIFSFCFSSAVNFYLRSENHTEPNGICDVSLEGNKFLSRDVYDVGAAGYHLTYYITEKYFLFERRYIVAVRRQMSAKEENKFINEDTLVIQGITYDISGHDVVFKQEGTDKEIHRKKRKNILFLF